MPVTLSGFSSPAVALGGDTFAVFLSSNVALTVTVTNDGDAGTNLSAAEAIGRLAIPNVAIPENLLIRAWTPGPTAPPAS
jgi:hypothetical protein